MPSSNKTPNHGLNQWTAHDKPKMSDFNADNTIIDNALTPTVNQATAPSSAGQRGTIAAVIGWLANRIRAITGRPNWHEAPAVTLAQCHTHIVSDIHTAATTTKAGIMSAADKMRLDTPNYGVCATAAGTAAKTVGVASFVRFTGARVTVSFQNGNTASSPTLNVNNTGAAAIVYRGAVVTAGFIQAGGLYDFIFNGSWWEMTDSFATGTVHGFMSAADKTKLDCIFYGVSSTAAGTAAKVVAVTGFTRFTGAKVMVKFNSANTAANPTLNVNSTGAGSIIFKGAAILPGFIQAHGVYEFLWNGSQYEMLDGAASGTHYGQVIFANNVDTTDRISAIPYRYLNALANVNLNDYRDNGDFVFYNISGTPSNFPAGTWTGTGNTPYLEVRRFHSNTVCRQILHKRGTNEMWLRFSTSATAWGAWERVTTSAHTHANATQSVAGFMSAADKQRFDSATNIWNGNSLMFRDASGRAQVGNPSAANDIVNRTFADSTYLRLAVASVMSAMLTAQSNANHTSRQVRNIIFWTSGTNPPSSQNGDVIIRTF